MLLNTQDVINMLQKVNRPFIINGKRFLYVTEECKELIETNSGNLIVELPPIENNTRCTFFNK